MEANNATQVKLTGQTDRPLIPSSQPCERYLLLAIEAPTPPRQTGRLPLNLSLIIDRSGSMSGANWSTLKKRPSMSCAC